MERTMRPLNTIVHYNNECHPDYYVVISPDNSLILFWFEESRTHDGQWYYRHVTAPIEA